MCIIGLAGSSHEVPSVFFFFFFSEKYQNKAHI